MKQLCKRLLRLIIEDYESFEQFCDEYGVDMDMILELKNNSQEAYREVGKLVYGEGFEWKEMERPVGVSYESILSVVNGVYRVKLVSGRIVEIDRGSMNLDRVNCKIYVEKNFEI